MADDQELKITVSLEDDASAQIDEIAANVSEGLDALSESASGAAGAFSDSTMTMEESFNQLNEIMQQDDQEVIDTMLQLGVSAQEAADGIAEANALIEQSTQEADDKVTGSTGSMRSNFIQLGIVAGSVFAPLLVGTKDAIQNAEDWNTVSATLGKTLEDTGSKIPLTQVQDFAKSMSTQVLFTDQAILQSAELIISHKSLAGSYENLTELSADLATKMQLDLPSATKVLTNALADPATGMSQLARMLNVDLDDAQKKAITAMVKHGDTAGADAMLIRDLTAQIGGVARAANDAADTGFQKLGQQLLIVSQTIGQDLAPAVQTLFDALSPVVTEVAAWTKAHPELTAAIIGVTLAISGLLVAMSAIGVLVLTIGPALGALAVVFSPIGLAVIGIIAILVMLGATIYELYNNWDYFWMGMSETFMEVWTGIKNFLGQVWKDIEGIIKAGINAVISPINQLIQELDSIKFTIPSFKIGPITTPAFTFGGLNIPQIPYLAEGGIVNDPTLAMIGEAGPEAVVPLNGNNQLGTTINIVINNPSVRNNNDISEMRKQIEQVLRPVLINAKIIHI